MKTWMKAAFLSVCLLALMTATAFAENVARIGSNEYPSIQAAVDHAKDGDTIYIIADHTIDTEKKAQADGYSVLVDIHDKKNITIDWNGKTVTAERSITDELCMGVIWASGDTQLTLKDSVGGGGLKAQVASAVSGKGALYCLIMNYNESANPITRIRIVSGYYEQNLGYDGRGMLYSGYGDDFTVDGGSFVLGNTRTLGNESPWIFNVSGNHTGRAITVNGGTFNDDISHLSWGHEAEIDKKKAMKQIESNTWTMVDSTVYALEKNRGYFKEIGYATLNDAVAMATLPPRSGYTENSDNSIELFTNKACLADDTVTIAKALKINLNGSTIQWEGDLTKPVITVADGVTLKIDSFKPVRDGYTFVKWYTDTEDNYQIGANGITGPISLYANFVANEYNITWMNEGTPYHTTTEHVFDTELALPAGTPTKEPSGGYSYEFIGWFTAPDGGEQILDGQTYKTPNDVTYYARYNAIALPQDELPQTGDDSNMMLYALLLGATMIGLGWTARKARA